jgi:hypothetical protein
MEQSSRGIWLRLRKRVLRSSEPCFFCARQARKNVGAISQKNDDVLYFGKTSGLFLEKTTTTRLTITGVLLPAHAGSRASQRRHPGRKRAGAGEPGAMDLRFPMLGNGSRIALPPSPFGFGVTSRASGMTIPLVRRPVAGACERALVVRRAHASGVRRSDRSTGSIPPCGTAPHHHEGFLRLAACGSKVVFPETVARPSGQNPRRWRRVTRTRTAAGAHPPSPFGYGETCLEGCGDGRPEHRKRTQQRLEPGLGERREANPVCARMCSGHGAHYAAG